MSAPSRLDLLVQTVRLLGGVARTRTLVAKGHSKHFQARAVAAGVLQRVGRSWMALSDADAHLVAAARCGVVLTCVTQARRLGLWVLDEPDGAHLAVPCGGKPRTRAATLHWARPPVPRHPDALVDSIENVLACVAACLPREQAVAVWESAVRQGLVTLESMRRLPLGPTARAVCEIAEPWADSGLESFVPMRLRWMRLPIRAQIWISGHRVDFLIGDRLALQIDGATHVGAQREADIAHDAALMLMGYHVIRVGYHQVVDRWHEVQAVVMSAVAQGLHRAA